MVAGPFTRVEGLQRLQRALPSLGRRYAASRNYAPDAQGGPTTTELSPFVRRRLVTEADLVRAAVDAHGARGAERFVQEVFWRTYFKGHLETRPSIWTDYLAQVEQGQERLEANAGLRTAYAEAVEGRTGVDGFDDWARQLVEQGWLHNHVRMWFASIWIFTLRLPWALGADLFMRRLVDGDPASNTLSWRWVAGLHTHGRAYVARAENIARYTQDRHRPTGLNEHPQALEETVDHPLVPLPPAGTPPTGAVALLLHLDDLHPESLPFEAARVTRVAALQSQVAGATAAPRAADGLARAGEAFACPVADADDPDWAAGLPVLTPWAPVGPSDDALPRDVIRLRRPWDERVWPLAGRGYFKVRAAIPKLLGEALDRANQEIGA